MRLPATEPMVASLMMLTTPVTVFVPEALEMEPVDWTPPFRTLPDVARLKFWEMVIPPASWKAELMPPAMATVFVPAPSAAELEATTTPWVTVSVPFQLGFGAARTSVPTSSLVSAAVGLPPNGVFNVRVLPVVT